VACFLALRALLPPDDRSGVALVVAAVLLLVPPLLLALVVVAVRALLALPSRLREVPGAVGGRVAEVRRRAAAVSESRSAWGRAGRTFALLRAAVSSREVLEVLTPAAALLRPWLLVAAPFATAAAVVEILIGGVAVAWLAL
jgi:hypothetical protein